MMNSVKEPMMMNNSDTHHVHDIMNDPAVIWCDNIAAGLLSHHDGTHQRSKHIDVRYHFIRSHIYNGDIVVQYISTTQQLADFLTKAMDRIKFYGLISQVICTDFSIVAKDLVD